MASTFPVYVFNGSTDYNAVVATTKAIHSFINRKRFSNDLSAYSKSILTEVNPILTALRFDASDDLDNLASWKKDAEYAYKLLYPLTT